jgi:helix-turn-helix protein
MAGVSALSHASRRQSRSKEDAMTEDDVLFGFRLRLFTLAEELGNVSEACRVMGVARSTYYAWKPKLERYGLDGLRVRERRILDLAVGAAVDESPSPDAAKADSATATDARAYSEALSQANCIFSEDESYMLIPR